MWRLLPKANALNHVRTEAGCDAVAEGANALREILGEGGALRINLVNDFEATSGVKVVEASGQAELAKAHV